MRPTEPPSGSVAPSSPSQEGPPRPRPSEWRAEPSGGDCRTVTPIGVADGAPAAPHTTEPESRRNAMASHGKKKTTMAKLNREARLRERRQTKEANKQARQRLRTEPLVDVASPSLAPDLADLADPARRVSRSRRHVTRAGPHRRVARRPLGLTIAAAAASPAPPSRRSPQPLTSRRWAAGGGDQPDWPHQRGR